MISLLFAASFGECDAARSGSLGHDLGPSKTHYAAAHSPKLAALEEGGGHFLPAAYAAGCKKIAHPALPRLRSVGAPIATHLAVDKNIDGPCACELGAPAARFFYNWPHKLPEKYDIASICGELRRMRCRKER